MSAADRADPATVVLVETDRAVRSALQFSLELDGFSVEAYADADSAAAAGLPERGCLVLDHSLPALDGLDLLARLRERAVRLPAILITSDPRRALKRRAAAAGARLLEKPLLGDALVDSVRGALDAAA